MKMKQGSARDSLGVLGIGAAACVACCVGPILAFLGGMSIAGLASTWLIGGAGLVIGALSAAAFVLVRHRNGPGAGVAGRGDPTPVVFSSRAAERRLLVAPDASPDARTVPNPD